MEFIPTIAMGILALKIVDLVRYAKAADFNGVVTQLAAWAAGVVVVLLASRTDWASGIGIGDRNLHSLNFWSLIFYGLSAGSVASFTKDTLKAVDNSNSAAIPTLMPPRRSLHAQGRPDSPREVG